MKVVALLHAINLGKTRRVAMKDLRDTLERTGLRDVKTHLQSGNVVFTTSHADVDDLRDMLEREFQTAFGFDVPVTLRTADEWHDVLNNVPFNVDGEEVRVAFLSSEPTLDAINALQQKNFGGERWQVHGPHFYQTVPDGTKNLKLGQAVIEKHLNCRLTVRNWRTVTAIHGLLQE